MSESPFHTGELAVQRRAGEEEMARRVGLSIADQIPGAAVAFLARQSFAVVGSVDAETRPWASLLAGAPGFVAAPHAGAVDVDLGRAVHLPDDPLWSNLAAGPRIGALFIDLETRRRLRVNGRAETDRGRRLRIAVEEAYGNCQKYIQRRTPGGDAGTGVRGEAPPARRGTLLEPAHRRWISGADTFFVASAHPSRGVDASHRGGRPGFVALLDEHTLRVPDYAGNGMFNTLGNLEVNPAAGLLFVDFERRATLQLTGRSEILWPEAQPETGSGETGRAWTLRVEAWVEHRGAALPRWELVEPSPFNP